MDSIDNFYVGIFPLFGILIADEVCHMSFDLEWNDAIVSGWYFESLLGNPNGCLLFTVSGVGEKSTIFLYVTTLFLFSGI